MKSNITSNFGPLLRACYVFLTAMAVIWATPRNAQAQLYVADAISNSIYAFNVETGQGIPATGIPFIDGLAAKGLAVSRNKLYVMQGSIVGTYGPNSGFPDNPDLITGLNNPKGLAVSADDQFVFVAVYGANKVGKYNANSRTFNLDFITGLKGPSGLALLGNTLFVANSTSGMVGVYNATSGAVINADLIKGLNKPHGLAVSGDKLFVVNRGNDTVGVYNANSGAAIMASLIPGLNEPEGLAVLGNTLFVADPGHSEVAEYNATTGKAINSDFVSLTAPIAVAVKGVGGRRK